MKAAAVTAAIASFPFGAAAVPAAAVTAAVSAADFGAGVVSSAISAAGVADDEKLFVFRRRIIITIITIIDIIVVRHFSIFTSPHQRGSLGRCCCRCRASFILPRRCVCLCRHPRRSHFPLKRVDGIPAAG